MPQRTLTTQKKKLGVVIGGSGLVGGTIVNYFKSKHPEAAEILAPSSKKLSIRKSTDIRAYFQKVKPDFVINTAIANIDADSQLAFEVNYLGPLNIARAATAMNIPYIHISSAATLPDGINLKEEDHKPITAKLSNYAKSKLMIEQTLRYMYENRGLDYTCIRLAVVYGNHDHKIQGFHRMFYSIADESMPFLFTKKGVLHSYSNCHKLPYFIHHMLDHRDEFSGQTCHFVDKEPVELANLILTIKSYLQLNSPREIYIPYPFARLGKKGLTVLLKMLRRLGLKMELPPELIFLGHFYKSQTLSAERLLASSFVDPMPNETVYTRLPEMVIYYLTRWSHQNLITTFDVEYRFDDPIEDDFRHRPQELLDAIHADATSPFQEMDPLQEK